MENKKPFFEFAELRPCEDPEIVRPLTQKAPGQMMFMDSDGQVWVWVPEEKRLRYRFRVTSHNCERVVLG